MRRLLAFVSLVVVLPLSSGAQQQARPISVKTASQSRETAPDAQAADLPVRRVVLYKNGVGYFEHIGRVRGNEDIHIDFTSGQLNDALASLTVLDLDGGRISGVSYNSAAPFDRRLGALRLPIDEQTSVSKFLDALRGSRLEVSVGGESVSGRLLSVERKTRTAGGTTLEVDIISVVTGDGEIREMEVTPTTRVRLVDTGMHGEMNRYLSLLASEREQDVRRMTVATTGTGERQLFVSYISEVPVWKTTYRLVLSSEPPRNRCCRDGQSWTTPLAKTGTTSIFPWWPERHNHLSSSSPSRTTGAERWCRFRRNTKAFRKRTKPGCSEERRLPAVFWILPGRLSRERKFAFSIRAAGGIICKPLAMTAVSTLLRTSRRNLSA